ncbi:hypothetical protein BDW74DRAFT_176032 [Aspergillus multicolor]|uniref:uncharacterized protein n=1 Tax=Aspergillus multicolor TaxID=41759 RepID=UPI003CCD6C46
MLSNDTRLPPFSETGGSGPWPANLYHPVKIMNPSSLTEALLTLLCRERAREVTKYLEEAESLAILWSRMLGLLYDSAGISIPKHVRPKFKGGVGWPESPRLWVENGLGWGA